MGENIEPNWRKAMLKENDGFYYWCLYSGPWSEVGAWLVWVVIAILRRCCSQWRCWHGGKWLTKLNNR